MVVIWLTLIYTLFIALLMVSKLPVFSGKRVGKRVSPEFVLPAFVAVVLFFAVLISYPWQVLSLGTFAYLICLPLGWLSYKEYVRKDAGAAVVSAAPAMASEPVAPLPGENRSNEQPNRLN
ncbi:MAG: hypothetical protein ACR2K5_07945 [Pseudolabrys sp.]